jgi:hypothetical protein
MQLTYGDTPEQMCQLHYGKATRFGTLIDPNGHKWLICSDCIGTLWKDKQPFNQDGTEPVGVPTILTDEAIDAIVAQMQARGYLNVD